MGDVVPFKKPDRRIEHADASTIVEKIEMTSEMKVEFEKLGYTVGDDDDKDLL